MKQLKILSNTDLLSSLKILVSSEREILAEILQHLCEVENRRLHLDEGYPSLFEYAVQVLNYSAAQAYRRISAMRLLRELPEIEPALKEGSLNLTQLTQAREYFKSESKSTEALSKAEKLDLLSSLENKSTRETEKFFAELDPEKMPHDQERPICKDQTEIRFIATDALLHKLNQFKDLDSHVQNNPSYAELFERLVDLALIDTSKNIYREKRPPRSKTKKSECVEVAIMSGFDLKITNKSDTHKLKTEMLFKAGDAIKTDDEIKNSTKTTVESSFIFVEGIKSGPSEECKSFSTPQKTKRSRHIPNAIKRIVLDRDGACCSFKNPLTSVRCGATHRLQFDHILPFAKNGTPSAENIRILCQSHNLMQAETNFGAEKMSAYH